MIKWQPNDFLNALNIALNRFNQIVHGAGFIHGITKDQDAAIFRFKFCTNLFLKVLIMFLVHEKIIAQTPREVLQKSYQFHLINDEKAWLSMLDDRNKTSHMYQEEMAAEICQRIPHYYVVMQATYEKLKKHLNS